MLNKVHPEVPDAAAVRSGFLALEVRDEAHWGTMDATRMVEHVARFNEMYLGRIPVGWGMRAIGRLMGGVVIRKFLASSPFDMKRGMTTLPVLRVPGVDVSAPAFEGPRQRVLTTFADIEAMSGAWDHPLYGRIDAATGQALARHHAAHHLRQFGRL